MNQAVKQQNIIIAWLAWHFYETPKFLFLVWGNYISFGLDYFSIPLLLMTLFSPWRKYKWRYPRGFSIGQYFGVLISNLFSRLIGFLCRTAFIVFGIIVVAIILIAGIVGILFWIAIPFLLIGLIWVMQYV